MTDLVDVYPGDIITSARANEITDRLQQGTGCITTCNMAFCSTEPIWFCESNVYFTASSAGGDANICFRNTGLGDMNLCVGGEVIATTSCLGDIEVSERESILFTDNKPRLYVNSETADCLNLLNSGTGDFSLCVCGDISTTGCFKGDTWTTSGGECLVQAGNGILIDCENDYFYVCDCFWDRSSSPPYQIYPQSGYCMCASKIYGTNCLDSPTICASGASGLVCAGLDICAAHCVVGDEIHGTTSYTLAGDTITSWTDVEGCWESGLEGWVCPCSNCNACSDKFVGGSCVYGPLVCAQRAFVGNNNANDQLRLYYDSSNYSCLFTNAGGSLFIMPSSGQICMCGSSLNHGIKIEDDSATNSRTLIKGDCITFTLDGATNACILNSGLTKGTVVCGTTCVRAPITCGTTCVRGGVVCGNTCVDSPSITLNTVNRTSWPEGLWTNDVDPWITPCSSCSPRSTYSCATTCVQSPIVCGTTCVNTACVKSPSICGTIVRADAFSYGSYDSGCVKKSACGICSCWAAGGDAYAWHNGLCLIEGSNITLTVDSNNVTIAGSAAGNWEDTTDPYICPCNSCSLCGTCHVVDCPSGTPAGDGMFIKLCNDDPLNAGCVMRYNSNNLEYASNSNETNAKGFLVLGTVNIGSSNQCCAYLTNGIFRCTGWNWAGGGLLYLSSGNGQMTQTRPSGSGCIVRILGYALNGDSIYFDPDKTYIEVN